MTTRAPGDVLTAAFTMTAAADLAKRTIAGVAVPYEVVGNTSWGRTVFAAGSLEVPDRVVMLVGHDGEKPIGLMAEHDDNAERLFASYSIAKTAAGDDALLEASEGIRNGLSVGVTIDAYEIDTENDWIRVTRAQLRETSLVTFPAFDSARVEKVAASQPTPHDHGAPAEPEKGTAMDEAQVNAAIAAAIDAAKLESAAPPAALPPARVQDPFPYGPHRAEASFFRDLLHAREDVDAARRFDQATTMMTAAGVSADVAEIIPTAYRPDLYVDQLNAPRTVIDSFGRFSIDGPNPFRIPKFDTATGLMSDHVEGTNPTAGTIAFDEQLITPKAVSGKYDASREMIEGSNPAVDAIIMAAIREEYAVDSEAYAITKFLAGATAGTVVDISNGATMQVRTRFITFQTNRKRSANVFLAGSDLFTALAEQVDLSGRPMNPNYGVQNAAGSVADGVESLEVAGRRTPLVAVLTGGLMGVRSDAATFESGLRTWRWEEVDGPANIRLAAFGYLGAAVIRAAGLLKFATQA